MKMVCPKLSEITGKIHADIHWSPEIIFVIADLGPYELKNEQAGDH